MAGILWGVSLFLGVMLVTVGSIDLIGHIFGKPSPHHPMWPTGAIVLGLLLPFTDKIRTAADVAVKIINAWRAK